MALDIEKANKILAVLSSEEFDEFYMDTLESFLLQDTNAKPKDEIINQISEMFNGTVSAT